MEFKDTLRQNIDWIEYYAAIQNSEYDEPISEDIRLKTLIDGILAFIVNDEETAEKTSYIKKIKAAKKRESVLKITHKIID